MKHFATAAALLFAAYVLSVGPVSWLMQHGRVPEPMGDFIQVAYHPLDWLGQTVGWFGGILEWYRCMWTG